MEEFYQSSHTQTLPPKKFMTLDASPRDKLLVSPKTMGSTPWPMVDHGGRCK